MPTLATPLVPGRVTETQAQPLLSAEALDGRRFGAEEEMGDTNAGRLVEQPWHTHAARYIAMGMSATETAKFCEKTQTCVSQLLRTPWFNERVKQFMSEGKVDIMALFKANALEAVTTLVEIQNNPKAPASARIACAKELLDRHLGKSTQHLEVKSENVTGDPVAKEKALQEEVSKIRESLKLNQQN